ncbi:flagellar hook-length control protein FliK [Sphingobium chlorophenolicum]|nr:flagellar hook-length control protein FliK [Sphingobium chlorophenolicum]
MLTSLKALLFSSVSAQIPADGAVAPVEGAADFAKLLNGTMEAAPEEQESGATPGLPLAVVPTDAAEGEGVEIAPAATGGEAEHGEAEIPAPWPFGLANALRAVQSHRKDSLPLPPGLARKIEAAAEPAEEAAAETPAPVAVEEGAADATEQAVSKPVAGRPVKEPKLENAGPLPEEPVAEGSGEPVKAAKDDKDDKDDKVDKDKPKEQAAVAPLPPILVTAAQTPVPPPPAVPSQRETAPVKLDNGKNLPVEAPLLPQAAEQARAVEGSAQPAIDAEEPAGRPKGASVTVTADDAPASADLPAPAAANRGVKSEALALLQLVRDQVAARQPGTPVRAGESLAARAKAGRAVTGDAAPPNPAQPMLTDAAPQPPFAQPTAIPSAQPVVAPQPVADLSASLGAQMIDMGVSGQWIDGLARDIAGLSANGAQGRFQINADRLGAVQVDIRQGSDGAAVSLTVASEAAEMALRQDSDRLRLDAGLSAVRIAEVKIERAPPVAEAARPDSANQQNSQQHPSGWANNGQNMAQSQGQAQSQGRWRPQENNAFAAKNSADAAVLNHDETRRAGLDAVRARYA